MNKNYSPNFNDPRVYERTATAIAFVLTYINTERHAERPCAQSQINKYIGRNDLGKFLKRQLLICTNHFFSYDYHICKKYIRNTSGIAYLTRCLEASTQSKHGTVLVKNKKTEAELKEQYSIDLSNITAGTLEYTLKSDRYWTPFQSVESSIRGSLLAEINFKHQYDTECAAPTLLHQKALQLGLVTPTPAIDQYITNRVRVRNELAGSIGISRKVAKTIINAMFCGAKIGASTFYQIYTLVDYDSAIIKKLKENPFVIQLKEDIRVMWKQMIDTGLFVREHKISTVTGVSRLVPISCSKKWKVYFACEHQVTDAATTYFNLGAVKYLIEHDGWTTNKEIDPVLLIDHIENITGFNIKLEHKILEKTTTIIQETVTAVISATKQYISSITSFIRKQRYITSSKNKVAGLTPYKDCRPVLV